MLKSHPFLTHAREAYEIAKKSFYPLLGGKIRSDDNNRGKIIYALLACKMGEHEHAYAVMGESRDSRPNYLRVNLTLKIFAELERYEEALAYILHAK